MSAGSFNGLVERLALSDEEALSIFELDALSAIAGEVAHRPEIGILDTLTAAAADQLGEDVLARWLRSGPPGRRALDLLIDGRFGDFEDRLHQRVAESA